MFALGGYPLITIADTDTIRAVAIGAALATMNVLIGFAAIQYCFGKSTTIFFKYVLGGMGVRLFVMAGFLILLIKVLHVQPAALVGSLGVFYVVFLTLEILFIQKKITIKHQS